MLLSGFGLGHIREYAPSALVGPWCLTAPCPHPQRLASHPSFKVSVQLIQMCENGTSCNNLSVAKTIKKDPREEVLYSYVLGIVA